MKFNFKKFFSLLMAGLLLGMVGLVPNSAAQDSPISTAAASQNQFAFDFYQQIRDENSDNLIFSAYSIWQAFAMVYAGARGNTESQMATALHYDLSQADLHAAIAALNADIASRGVRPEEMTQQPEGAQPLQLNIANGLWGQVGIPFEQPYLDILAAQYQNDINPMDFMNGSPDENAAEINEWVADQTEDKILDVVSPGALLPDTKLVLANAIYFKGSWWMPFSPEATQDEPFYLLDGSDVTVPMMFQNGTFRYAATDSFEVVELPYANGTAAMMLILPANGSFEGVEQGFDLAMFDALRAQLETNTAFANLYLPIFEYRTSLDQLGGTLEELGMTDAFNPCVADLTGILQWEKAGCENNLSISAVVHQAYIKVNEEGTEAAAVTIIGMEGTTISVNPSPVPIELRFDRPFLYAIYDKPTGTILFMGRVMNPAAE